MLAPDVSSTKSMTMVAAPFKHSPGLNGAKLDSTESSLALDGGISEGIEIIGRYLSALNRAVSSIMEGVASFSRLAAVLQTPDTEQQAAPLIPTPALTLRPETLSERRARIVGEPTVRREEFVSQGVR